MFRFPLLLILFFVGCFEYEETILFRKLSSGTVEISYTVPLKKDSNDSLIKFLPTSKEEIISSVKKKSNHNLQVRDFTFRELEKSETTDMYFKRKGKVSYKLDFEDPIHLEGVLIGTFSIKSKPRSLTVKRDFPNLTDNAILETSVGEKKIISETSRLLKEGKIQFKVLFPKDSECSSNRGFIGLGNLTYQIPLPETLENPESKTWEYKIRFF
ncbi:hypothetical protein ND861_05565 [Leptospira sp. 2 VSF19]|uniref:Lipoprotein n=1 Tax=Leptospira soteropolitanensis TaxID=2950025 RepID=A0AAW5VKF2_9LEPT|nr:hypothetical protein [Leptospira soteropolitanensis]MCW7492121.1 hypothetical protein [Leptospira soteropolitanensis]MCW7499703.1 hypothetical protein [Leptospira soteropolitanensis]MCW7521954.1 hypothetical protein [Leptospira soteropolitanensis]MCW7525808.1 hypothetical protein [Leptospira soteropolitanensis]MCW7530078.1 hypothetical protein [Leptospira soteropolitanensis]